MVAVESVCTEWLASTVQSNFSLRFGVRFGQYSHSVLKNIYKMPWAGPMCAFLLSGSVFKFCYSKMTDYIGCLGVPTGI